MNFLPRTFALSAAFLAVSATLPSSSLAQDVRREDMVLFFQMNQIDSNRDGMVSKKEFMDTMAKTWDMHMAEAAKAAGTPPGKMKAPTAKDRMTLDEYRAFAKMFMLDIGS